jgi:hypothetical protein
VIKEIIVALIKTRTIKRKANKVKCGNCEIISCGSIENTFRHAAGMMMNSRKFFLFMISKEWYFHSVFLYIIGGKATPET